jgi:sodium/potassium-transporting ATPase subunit alpha
MAADNKPSPDGTDEIDEKPSQTPVDAPADTSTDVEKATAAEATIAIDQRIQFAPSVRHARGRAGAPIPPSEKRRASSVTSIPRVPDKSERKRAAREAKGGKGEEKNVDIDEHLMTPEQVAERYKTRISIAKPAESGGLTAEQAEKVLAEVGRNVLTPPKKRHPFLKYLDCLRSLFNLLLILAGVLEYILLGIDYKDNFQNVSQGLSFPAFD